jgi:hypothetical protein
MRILGLIPEPRGTAFLLCKIPLVIRLSKPGVARQATIEEVR